MPGTKRPTLAALRETCRSASPLLTKVISVREMMVLVIGISGNSTPAVMYGSKRLILAEPPDGEPSGFPLALTVTLDQDLMWLNG